jgi:hypothetical protein
MILTKWSDPTKVPDFAVNIEKVSYEIDKCCKNRKLSKFPPDIARQYTTNIVNGLLHQLLSFPVQMIAINIIRKEFPGLNDIMKIAVNNEIQELHQSLDLKIRQLTPEDIFEKNASMNAALTLNWSRISDQQHLLVPFKAIEVLEKGEYLLKLFDSVPVTDAQRYTKTVDMWAGHLKMVSLYTWKFRNEKK